jgi:DNA-binding NtrC family response regulator
MSERGTVVLRTRILALSFKGASDLLLALKSILGAHPSFEFDLVKKELPYELAVPRLSPEAPASANPHIVLLCLPPGRWQGTKIICETVRERFRAVPIVVATEVSDPGEWCELLALGPDDFITPPFRAIDVLPRLWRLRSQVNEADSVVLQLKEKLGLQQLVGESPALLAEVRKIPRIAPCDASVLITGETGTGKEMFARAIHFLSGRSAKPFNALNCGAIPVDLIENELFGHERGAFTGAHASAAGILRETDGGSLFLDEVDCLPLLAQVKLLRFLQEKAFRPLGADKTCQVDVRVIAASNVNLRDAMKNGLVRQDLFYRLNVVGLALPPLRERKDDIPVLARHFVSKYAQAFDGPARGLTTAAEQKLMLYDWPGNVRELENVIERAVVLSPHAILRSEDIELPAGIEVTPGESFHSLKSKMISQFERGYIQELLRSHDGNITRAARAAGKHRRAFWEMMRKHGIGLQPRVHN